MSPLSTRTSFILKSKVTPVMKVIPRNKTISMPHSPRCILINLINAHLLLFHRCITNLLHNITHIMAIIKKLNMLENLYRNHTFAKCYWSLISKLFAFFLLFLFRSISNVWTNQQSTSKFRYIKHLYNTEAFRKISSLRVLLKCSRDLVFWSVDLCVKGLGSYVRLSLKKQRGRLISRFF